MGLEELKKEEWEDEAGGWRLDFLIGRSVGWSVGGCCSTSRSA